MELKALREQIESLDSELLQCLAKRRQLALDVARNKAKHEGLVRDTGREAELLMKLMEQGRDMGLDPGYLTRLYHIIIEDSVLTQHAWIQQGDERGQLAIAHLGMPGSYSHLTAQSYATRRNCSLQGLSCETFEDVVAAVEDGRTTLGVLPIENTSSGSINDVYDLLRHTHLHIIGEAYLPVDHHLLSTSEASIENIKKIYAHPQALTQCSSFLQRLNGVELQACASSAHAMKLVADSNDPTLAAIGPQSGGALYDLFALADSMANQKENHTRFIVVSRDPLRVPSQLPSKTSLIMATHNQPGSLVDALLILRAHDINMTKLESRPMPGNPWEELFYVDVLVNSASTQWEAALKELSTITRFVKVLGCYPDERIKATHAPITEREFS
ncbi:MULTISPECIES: chorismate mutase [Gammaproteobacteria]|uniref:chorismate mutase n=1 Tax=Gammaproteobacteria TaxID=1236 RepID=UPI000DD09AC1|nr:MULTISPECIES: chorismate mutase [Gammaproteobacteria]RTE85744.1 chorismate mutase [Aliidiomarina sp. B3213]TCZ90254.1 chorismate mutase [Lysobacter sp. N42]